MLITQNTRLATLPEHSHIRDTHIGQAGIAGQGPEDTQCYQCAFWQLKARGLRDKQSSRLKDSRCLYPIHGKADAAFPADAMSCRNFQFEPQHPQLFDWSQPKTKKGKSE